MKKTNTWSADDIGSVIAVLLFAVLAIIGAWGWVLNIISLATNSGEGVVLIILRFIGIFMAPLGAILGFAV